MMNSKSTGQLTDIPMKQNPLDDHDYCLCTMDDDISIGKLSEPAPLEIFFELESLSLLQHNTYRFEGFEDVINFDNPILNYNNLLCWDEDITPLNSMSTVIIGQYGSSESINVNSDCETVTSSMIIKGKEKRGRKRSSSSVPLELEEIQKHFDMSITKASKEMKVGLTALKKRCRELDIMRWPHRKIKSLKSLINNVKEMGLTEEIVKLEEHKRLVERMPDIELTERAKKLRQACFKANYKKKRSLALHA